MATIAFAPAQAQTAADLRSMSIEQLANVDVTSVSKRAEPLSEAPAAVYVITHDEIVRSGARTLPEILRLAPNLQVAQITAHSYAITARGFNGNAADKLLVLIDGRSVYSQLFGGVLWDELDVPPEDIERVEVISGPGATLWGANAVNGVINIITRQASETQGGLLELDAGDHGQNGLLQFGGRAGADVTYRAYVAGMGLRSDTLSTGADAQDGQTLAQGGFRLDWTPGRDLVALQANYYRGAEQQPGAPSLSMSGGSAQVNWRHQLAGDSAVDLTAYYEGDSRDAAGGTSYWFSTYDVEAQHDFSLGRRQKIVWGAGVRIYQDRFENVGSVVYLPPASTETLLDGFVQDTVSLTSTLDLIAGLKLEKDPYSDVAALPNVRLAWKPSDTVLLWAAASRAIRAPTLFDENLRDTFVPGVLVLQGNPNFKSEKLTAYEAGARVQMTAKTSMSVSAYYNVYTDLRSVEVLRAAPLPILWTWGNLMEGRTYGVEAWGDYRPLDWWSLSASLTLQHQDLRFEPQSSGLGGVATAGDDPHVQAALKSSMTFSPRVSWTADLRYVGVLPNPHVPAYAELDTALVWGLTDRVALVVAGDNLLHAHHLEYEEAGATVGTEVPRSFTVGAKLRF